MKVAWRFFLLSIGLSCQVMAVPTPSFSFEAPFSREEAVDLSFFRMNEAIVRYNRSPLRASAKRKILPALSMKGVVRDQLSEAARRCVKYKTADAHKSLLFPMGFGKWLAEGMLALDADKGTLGYHTNVAGRWYYCQVWGPQGFEPYDPSATCTGKACDEERYKKSSVPPLVITSADYRVEPFRVSVGVNEYPTYRIYLKVTGEKFDTLTRYFSEGQERARVEAILMQHLNKDGEVDIQELLPEIPRKFLYQVPVGATSYTMARYFHKAEPMDGFARSTEKGSENGSDPLYGLLDKHYCEPEDGQHFGDLLVDSSREVAGRVLVGPYLIAKTADDPTLPYLVLQASSDQKDQAAPFNSWRMLTFRRCK